MDKNFLLRPLAITDVETTGLDPELHEIVELGVVVVDQKTFRILSIFNTKVTPGHIETASPKALRINGYREEDWEDAWSLDTAMGRYAEETKGAVFCAHNVTFDWSFISRAFAKTRVECKMDYHRIDLLTLAWWVLRERGLKKFSLRDIAGFLGISPEPMPHRAIHGAMLAYLVLKKLKEVHMGIL